MAANITVTYSEAIEHLYSKLNKNDIVSFAEIASHLKDGFPGINDNQISGLINKMSNNLAFIKTKVPGSRATYKFNLDALVQSNKPSKAQSNDSNKTALNIKVESILNAALSQIQQISYQEIKESKNGFSYLENIEKVLTDLLSEN